MLFITSRHINQGAIADSEKDLPRTITFDTTDNQARQKPIYGNRRGEDDYVQMGMSSFFEALEIQQAKNIFFFIHGFNVKPERAFQSAIALQGLLDDLEADVKVVPVIWSSHWTLNFVEKYFADRIQAESSGVAIARSLLEFQNWKTAGLMHKTPIYRKFHIMAHSMGNRVLRASIRDLYEYFCDEEVPYLFKSVSMVAADLPNEALHNGEVRQGGLIPFTCDWLCAYYARDDVALDSSAIANGFKTKMLGETGIEDIEQTLYHVHNIDCSSFNQQFDDPLGHNYFLSNSDRISPVLEHIAHVIKYDTPVKPPLSGRQFALQ